MKKIIIITFIIILLTISCKTHYITKHKVYTPNGNFYVDHIKFANDSVYLVEFNPNGKIRRNGVFKESEVTIK